MVSKRPSAVVLTLQRIMNFLVTFCVEIFSAYVELCFHVVAPNPNAAKSQARMRFLTQLTRDDGTPFPESMIRYCGAVNVKEIRLGEEVVTLSCPRCDHAFESHT